MTNHTHAAAKPYAAAYPCADATLFAPLSSHFVDKPVQEAPEPFKISSFSVTLRWHARHGLRFQLQQRVLEEEAEARPRDLRLAPSGDRGARAPIGAVGRAGPALRPGRPLRRAGRPAARPAARQAGRRAGRSAGRRAGRRGRRRARA